MESSRVFVRGLPSDTTPAELKRHFSKSSPVTDVRCIPQRRIGYVGYKSPADAAAAIKYYNKCFIRMSRIYVEPARPVEDQYALRPQVNTANIRSDTGAATTKGNSEAAQNTNKRKRDDGGARLQEFLDVMEPPSKAKAWANRELSDAQTIHSHGITKLDTVSKDVSSVEEHESISRKREPRPNPKPFQQPTQAVETAASDTEADSTDPPPLLQSTNDPQLAGAPVASDEDWLRSRTSRLLGLLDDDEKVMVRAPLVEDGNIAASFELQQASSSGEFANAATQAELEPSESDQKTATPTADRGEADVGSGRVFVRNLAYTAIEEDLRKFFESHDFGPIEEIHVPLNHRSGTNKGYAYVQYKDPQAANNALGSLDGISFHGRLLHILPAALKKQTGLDEFAISKLPLKKQQQIKRKAEAASSTFNWNAMFMNADAVISSISERLGVPKSELLDPTSSDAAVKQAHAETHVLQETKAYFTANGVDLAAFNQKARGDTTILVKNFSFETKATDLKTLFESYGPVSRLLMPPSGTIAIVEFNHADDARSAFAGMAYRKVKDSILFLEKAPREIFGGARLLGDDGKTVKPSNADILEDDKPQDPVQSSTLFISNLNFATTTERLRELFKPLNGFMSAKVKQKPNLKKAGQYLSMGFGFVEFRTKAQAQAALTALDNHNLDGHKLLIRSSHKGIDAAEERKKEDTAKKIAGKKTKIIIKNLPFEASRKDVRSLLGPYGQLRSVRVPKKFDTSTRGFAFAEFVSAKEAANAVEALKDTHLLGRRLVLEFAAEDAIDPEVEIAKMQRKVGKQADKVALQRLTGTGRKKFNIEVEEDG